MQKKMVSGCMQNRQQNTNKQFHAAAATDAHFHLHLRAWTPGRRHLFGLAPS
jgi:hypothetical protein